jgi:long-chain acyl-CoA synthetase
MSVGLKGRHWGESMSTTFGLHRALQFDRDGIATQFEGRQRSWAEVADRVARLAGALQRLDMGRGDRVAILMLNQDRYFELYLAIAWAGVVVVPLNIRWSAAENQDGLSDCRPKLLFVDAAFAARGAQIAKTLVNLGVVYADDAPQARPEGALDHETLIAETAPIPDVEAPETDLAGIFYTGGTTGRSKGVMLSHRNLVSHARNAAQAMAHDLSNQCYLHAAPMFHLADVGAMTAMLLLGGGHAFIRVFTPEAVARAIEQFRVTDVLLVPTMMQMFVDQPDLSKYDLGSLRHVIYGASPISETVLDRAISRPAR